MRVVDDCVTKLKMLEAKGRLWPQDMMLELQGDSLLLSDIETKVGRRSPEGASELILYVIC